MYLKVSEGTVSIGEAQIRATISGQGLAAGLGDWNGRININQNIGFVDIGNGPYIIDVFEDRTTVTIPKTARTGLSQSIGNIAITKTNFLIDRFTDRTWIAEILRTFVLTSVRGNPKYNNFITINSNDQFLLRSRHVLDSNPSSLDRGFLEQLIIDTVFLETVDAIEINGYTAKYRPQFLVNTSNTAVFVPDEIDISNLVFELKAITSEEQKAVDEECEEGFLTCLTIDISAFDGVKGVEFSL